MCSNLLNVFCLPRLLPWLVFMALPCLCLYITPRLPHQQFLSNGLWQGYVGVHTLLPVKLSNPSCCCCCLCPHWVTGKSQYAFGKTQVTSHNESQFTKNISETLRLRNHTDWSRRFAGLNMNPTALGQVLWTAGKMVSAWEVNWRSFCFCDHTHLVLHTRCSKSDFHHLTLCSMPEVFCCIQRKWILFHLK